jgi:photosystem II stability/assembly factor-like uncharacterized protein
MDRTVSAIHSRLKFPKRLLAALQEELYRSEDMGKSWRKIEMPVAADIVAFSHHPECPALVFAATGKGTVLKSADGGTQWTRQN